MPRLTIYFALVLSLLIGTIPLCNAKNQADKNFTVVIDPGHGGKDVGATDNGVMEKNINLKVAKQLESLIKKKMKDTKVVMTRDDDTYLTLQQRADKANKAHGDIFISIHTNSVDKKNKNRKSIAGSSVYTLGLHKDENNLQVAMRENSVIELEPNYEQKYSGFDPQRDESYIIFEMAQKKNLSQSIKLAENIEKQLINSGRQDRGVHQAGFWVLWATAMPAVLVELDFICNPESAKYMNSDKGAKELAEAIFNAVERYSSSAKGTITYNESDNQAKEAESISADEAIAVATARKKKTSSSVQESGSRQINGNYSSLRKRRSKSAKQKSLEADYEYNNLKPIYTYTASVAGDNGDGNTYAVVADLPQELSNDSKAEVKSKGKNKQKKEKEEKQSKTKGKKQKNISHNAKLTKLVTVYKIQLLASHDLLNQGNSRFCGLSPISTYKENNLYKYYYGESTDKVELEAVLADVLKKIPDAFIVSSTKSVQAN